jgi:alpha-N-arabinofuranosidase
MQLTKKNPLHEATPNSLQISIPQNPGEVKLINGGFWGIGVKNGERYNLRFYLRAPNYKGTLVARLVSAAGDVIAEKPVNIKNDTGWNEYKLVLIPGKTEAKARLTLCFKSAGTVWIDYVSLFPEMTFKNRPNGLRKDVAEFLEALHPGFIRWPGGCVVEGITLNNRFEWKKTLGDPMTRKGEYDTWGYHNTYGFGYHEFLQYCEDIGAMGMFVCNVGIGCQARVGDACTEDKVNFYINDALDAIEYAIGDPSTKWGLKRTAAGHPEPFPLKYVEIGNENSGPVYNRRFDLFYSAIKAKYPQLVLISNHGLGDEVNKVAKTDMIDPHWYVAPDFFFRNAGTFDKQPRRNYKVYVGEYACNQGVGSGNMLAALSEAAFITGMERNSDLVTMASYAPLLENRNDRVWPVNLIWIDNLQVVGRSSYYVQKMVGENLPDYNLQTVVTPRPVKALTLEADGCIGVGTWSTQAEYKDFKITSGDGTIKKPAIRDWLKLRDEWTITDGIAAQNSLNNLTALIWNTPLTGDYTFEFKARKIGGNEGFLVYFGMSDRNQKGFFFNIGGWGNTLTAMESIRNGTVAAVISEQIPQTIEVNKWYLITVKKSNQSVEIWVDGAKILKYLPTNTLSQFAVGGYNEASGEVIVKVVNAEETPWRSSVRISNSGKILAVGEVVTLSARSLDAENSFEQPVRISPVRKKYDKFSSEFIYEFEPASFTILRIKTSKKL